MFNSIADVELDLLDQGAACLSISRSEYLRKLLLEKQINHQIEVIVNMNDLRKLVSEYGKISKVTTTLSATIQPMLQKTDLPEREHRQSVWNLQSGCFPDIRHWWLLIPIATMNPEISILTSS